MNVKTQTSKSAALAIVLLAGTLTVALPVSAGSSFDPAKETVLPSTAVVFNKINPAISMGGAYGDMTKGAHGTFGKFPANFETPYHSHSGAYHGVVISDTMTNPFAGEKNPPKMAPGSYWYVPANAVHATACVSTTPCQFYFHAKEKFDFHVKK